MGFPIVYFLDFIRAQHANEKHESSNFFTKFFFANVLIFNRIFYCIWLNKIYKIELMLRLELIFTVFILVSSILVKRWRF